MNYSIIGVYKYESSSKNYQTFTIKVADNIDVQEFTDSLNSYLSNLYSRNDSYEASVASMESMIESRSSMLNTVALAISVIICASGDVIGIVLGVILATVGAKLLSTAPVVSVSVILISFTFSMAIGVFFWYYPAKKAAELNPIEVLRYE